jgi:hypothetical protein
MLHEISGRRERNCNGPRRLAVDELDPPQIVAVTVASQHMVSDDQLKGVGRQRRHAATADAKGEVDVWPPDTPSDVGYFAYEA